GPSMDIVAPGAGIFSTMSTPSKPNTFAKLDGTSMASPVVAGVVSLIKSKHPDLNTYQVEALLKQTADDLGETGYDSTYGHGLINAIAALNYDVNNLPKYEKKASAATLENATTVTLENNSLEKTGELKSPFETHNYKVDLEAGNYAQFTLSGAEAFDYKLRLHFYPEGSTEATETVTVNDVFAGQIESGLFQAPSKGTLVAEVMDANGNYSVSGASTYSLAINVEPSVNDNIATQENPYGITSLPFQSKDMGGEAPVFVNEEGADTDYYRVQFPSSGYGSVNIEAIAGLNAAISIYPEGKEEDVDAHVYGDSGFVNERESVAFPVQAYQTYIVEVTGNPGVENPSENRTYGTILPYELTIDMANMPQDEDDFSFQHDELDFGFGVGEPFPAELSEKIMQSAIEMSVTDQKTAVFQQNQDIDLYKIKVEEDTIVSTKIVGNPIGEARIKFLEYDEESGFLSDRIENSLEGQHTKIFSSVEQQHVLEANQQYVIALATVGNIIGQSYEFKMQEVMKITKDQHGVNDEPEIATPIQINSTIKDRALNSSDFDTYYYKPTEDTLTSFSVNAVDMDKKEMEKYPIDLVFFPLYVLFITEDTNGNGTIDPEEQEKVSPYTDIQESIAGSFKGKKDVGYFITVVQHPDVPIWLNIREYELSLTAVNGEDEDKDSVVKKNIPSKPLALTAGDNGWTATGLYNGGVEFGDSDYYLFNNNKKQNVTVSVTSPAGLDSVLSIYNHKGRLIQKVDTYFVGDIEEVTVNLNKGRYFIKVEEVNGASSNNPYTVSVKVK
ncbi:S8 family serine peptidase, partial [Bacillus manliponensis]